MRCREGTWRGARWASSRGGACSCGWKRRACAAPWHAASHPFNMTLITVDLVVGGAALFCLTQGKKAKAKLF